MTQASICTIAHLHPPLDETANLRTEVERYPWYHTLELAEGVVTAGMFDHRPVLDRYPIPADLSGKRCLDVATMDGFWAFEMERRGAESATALDLEDPEQLAHEHQSRDCHHRLHEPGRSAIPGGEEPPPKPIAATSNEVTVSTTSTAPRT